MDLKQEWSPMLGIYEPQLLEYISKNIETLIRWQMLWLKKKEGEEEKFIQLCSYWMLLQLVWVFWQNKLSLGRNGKQKSH